MISELIENSFKALQSIERDLLVMKYPKQYSNIFKNSVIETYYPQILKNIQHYNNFDKTLCQLHYNNGYIDLIDMKFKQRVIGQHYIINYIKRDYKPSTIEQQEKIMKPNIRVAQLAGVHLFHRPTGKGGKWTQTPIHFLPQVPRSIQHGFGRGCV